MIKLVTFLVLLALTFAQHAVADEPASLDLKDLTGTYLFQLYEDNCMMGRGSLSLVIDKDGKISGKWSFGDNPLTNPLEGKYNIVNGKFEFHFKGGENNYSFWGLINRGDGIGDEKRKLLLAGRWFLMQTWAGASEGAFQAEQVSPFPAS